MYPAIVLMLRTLSIPYCHSSSPGDLHMPLCKLSNSARSKHTQLQGCIETQHILLSTSICALCILAVAKHAVPSCAAHMVG